MAKKISETLKPHLVLLHMKAAPHGAALKDLTALVGGNPDVVDLEGFYKEIMAREKKESTCLGGGIAFPHARTDCVKRLVIIAGRSQEGIRFENAGQDVHLIFVIGTPVRMVTEYLATVGALARLLKDEPLRQRLMSAKTGEEFLAELSEAESRL